MKFIRALLLAGINASLLSACQSSATISALPTDTKNARVQALGATAERAGSSALNPQIFVYTQDIYRGAHVVEFDAKASGNVAPVRRFAGGFLAVTAAANFWSGPTSGTGFGLHTPAGKLVDRVRLQAPPDTAGFFGGFATDRDGNAYVAWGTPPAYPDYCRLDGGDVILSEYAAKSRWERTTRTLDIGPQCSITSIAVDGFGKVYVATQTVGSGITWGDARILVYAPGAQGSPKPIRSITVPGTGTGVAVSHYGIYQIVANGAGDLFMDEEGSLYEYSHEHPMRRQRILDSAPSANAFAVGPQGHIYIAGYVPNPENPKLQALGVEEFALGSTSPIRTIAGSRTHIQDEGGASYLWAVAVVP
jgi:hypothetical protein